MSPPQRPQGSLAGDTARQLRRTACQDCDSWRHEVSDLGAERALCPGTMHTVL